MVKNRWLRRTCLVAVVPALFGAAAVWAQTAHSDLVGCDGCHTPHNADRMPGVPLWNGSETTTTFTMYSSATFQGTIDGQPSGASKLCLSCHDGANPNFLWMTDEKKFGSSELANSHPISFVYDSALAAADRGLKDPAQASTLGRTIGEDLLDPEGKMQCNSCHDVHTSGVGEHQLRGYDYGLSTVSDADGSTHQIHHGPELCRMCHLK